LGAEAASDHKVAARIIERLRTGDSVREDDAYIAWLTVKTEVLVNRFWPKIEKVAKALLKRQTLDRAEILKLLA